MQRKFPNTTYMTFVTANYIIQHNTIHFAYMMYIILLQMCINFQIASSIRHCFWKLTFIIWYYIFPIISHTQHNMFNSKLRAMRDATLHSSWLGWRRLSRLFRLSGLVFGLGWVGLARIYKGVNGYYRYAGFNIMAVSLNYDDKKPLSTKCAREPLARRLD